jgi:hypothetical protein
MTEVHIPVPIIEGNAVVDIIRGIVRPAFTLGGGALIFIMVLQGNYADMPREVTVAVFGFAGWWFGSRPFEKQANGGK